jgi:hypothetical protein
MISYQWNSNKYVFFFADLGLPVLVIPWVVMQELDALKSNKSSVASMVILTIFRLV